MNYNILLKKSIENQKSKEKLIFYECKIRIVKKEKAYTAKLRPIAP